MKHKADKRATLKSNGNSIIVYKLNNGNWCDSVNCTDQYEPIELILPKNQ